MNNIRVFEGNVYCILSCFLKMDFTLILQQMEVVFGKKTTCIT